MKKIGSIVLAVILLLSTCIPAFALERTCTDVAEGEWYFEAVEYVTACDLMVGVSDTEFAPDSNMTRSMFATILWRMEEQPKVNENWLLEMSCYIFADSPQLGDWDYESVAWITEQDIMQGESINSTIPTGFTGFFHRKRAITRQEMATVIYRYAIYKNMDVSWQGDTSIFVDAPDVALWAEDAVTWCVGAGLLQGAKTISGDLFLNPTNTLTRAEAATVLMRLCHFLDDAANMVGE